MKSATPISIAPTTQVADCYWMTLIDGTPLQFTNFDTPVVTPPPNANGQLVGKYGIGSTFRFTVLRVARGNMTWEIGTKPSALTITIGAGSVSKVELGLDWKTAAVRGLLDWALIRVWRAFGNQNTGGLFTPRLDGAVQADFSLPLFIGYVASATIDRGSVVLQCFDPRIIMNMMLPRYTFGALCRWTLYDNGCGVNRQNFAVNTTVAAGSTRTLIQVPPFTGPVPGPPSPGWFNQGYVLGYGRNANQRASIRQYTPAVQNWINTALGDGAIAFYPCADAPGSAILQDVSGNNFNGAVHGAVQFGNTNLGPGWNLAAGMPPPYNTSAFFNNQPNGGGNAYVSCPIPAPWQQPGYGGGVTIEFVANVLQQGANDYLNGIYDSGPGQNYTLRFWRGPGASQGQGGPGDWVAEWAVGSPYAVGDSAPNGVACHVCIVYRSQQTVDVYINGILAVSYTDGGQGLIGWGGVTDYGGGSSGLFTIGRVVNLPSSTVSGPDIQGNSQYFGGYLQGFGVYGFPFSPSQALAHANAALKPYSTSATASLQLVSALPVQPVTGDQITVYPGCDLTYPTCIKKFNNQSRFGGFPTIPDPEQAV